ncbi:helix-turn-helix domain-containing protein [Streptantibioticus ferralitis]|uniref:Helix-turn-helix transcriptional regulator n=1 Tax=Streptantibioticus ferralitis TaxID=236510 RepID=A0ABT5Z6J6_9ACTN|nr:helix-turn-helix transcriptional regulator [Streptantibioticus ferralitis]MDF2259452.1 helix-turn-helix transcriptional regulator [Streptantibioticus ferralitis]
MESTPAAGENIAVLRKARGMGQAKLAREAGISLSYLSKIEVGTRPATPPVVAAIAKALHVTTARIYGQPFMGPSEQADLLNELRSAVRRNTLPRENQPAPDALAASLRKAAELRAETRYLELLRVLPKLLGEVIADAMASDGDATAWGQVADVYGCAYAVAHRLGQPDLADMIVSRQVWAAQQTWNPQAEAAAAWNEAGTYQSAGQYEDGLAIVERAIVKFEQAPTEGLAKLVPLGSLHLRGVVLASRNKDARATEDHLRRARILADQMTRDVLQHNLTFGAGNTALYELAAHVELGKPDKAAQMSAPLITEAPAGLKPNRIGRLYIDVARARLAVKDLTGAEEALKAAFAVAPQMTEIHPMSREVLRVLFVLHQRTRPDLMWMAKRSGLVS